MVLKGTYYLVIIFGVANLFSCGSSSERIEKNIQNSQKLKVGMTLDEALKIMGEPDQMKVFYPEKHPKYNSVLTAYYYESPFGASDWIHFEIDTTNRVVEVTPFEFNKD